MTNIGFTKQEACRYLIHYHHLSDNTSLHSEEDIIHYVEKVGCIQFDPLNVVGRNADLVLQARYNPYKKNDIEKLLYHHRYLFDVWDKNMSIASVNDWPYLYKKRERSAHYHHMFGEAIESIRAYLLEHEYACSSDFKLEDKVDWHYGPQRLSKAALECMCYFGTAVVHHKNGTRRYYCLSENYIPKHLLETAKPHESEEDYYKWQVLRRINSIGLLWNRGGDAWLGISEFKREGRNKAFAQLLNEGLIKEMEVEGISFPFYIDTNHFNQFLSSIREPIPTTNTRFIAPLDNLIWDRKMIAELFGFDYKWEVYVPAEKRKYGYYVLPVLCGECFVGRIEMGTDKETSSLVIQSFWWEENIKPLKKYVKSIQQCINRFAKYNLCDHVIYECEI